MVKSVGVEINNLTEADRLIIISIMRTMQIDPDYRRNPKTAAFCFLCQKDLKNGEKAGMINVINDGSHIVHPADAHLLTIKNSIGAFPVGAGCARKLGKE